MDTPQLKLLAGLLRALLEQHDVTVGHAQSLELISAVPGLRNWSEVQAFPDRVASSDLDAASTGRLSYRLRKRFGLDLSTPTLMVALSPPQPGVAVHALAPRIWPTGPRPGVYITTSQDAIDAILAKYEDATDGEVVYAEQAGAKHDGAIELGEWGLSSNGLSRVPSGTLFVIGPVELNQQSWEDSTNKLEWGCIRASEGQRVVILLDTPSPETLHFDVELMVRDTSPESHWGAYLVGDVAENGDLLARVPFVQPDSVKFAHSRPANPKPHLQEALSSVSSAELEVMRNAFGGGKPGIAAFGTNYREEHHGIDLMAAALGLTEGFGPAARVKPRNRSTPAKDMMVPEPVKTLPFLTSIESAYALGFRRMVVDCGYTDLKTLLKYEDVLFLTGTYGAAVEDVLMAVTRHRGDYDNLGVLAKRTLIALGRARMKGKHQEHDLVDAYVKIEFDIPSFASMPAGQRYEAEHEAIMAHIVASRELKWEEAAATLLRQKAVTKAAMKEQLGRRLDIDNVLGARRESSGTHS